MILIPSCAFRVGSLEKLSQRTNFYNTVKRDGSVGNRVIQKSRVEVLCTYLRPVAALWVACGRFNGLLVACCGRPVEALWRPMWPMRLLYRGLCALWIHVKWTDVNRVLFVS